MYTLLYNKTTTITNIINLKNNIIIIGHIDITIRIINLLNNGVILDRVTNTIIRKFNIPSKKYSFSELYEIDEDIIVRGMKFKHYILIWNFKNNIINKPFN